MLERLPLRYRGPARGESRTFALQVRDSEEACVPIAPVDTIVLMKLIAGRTQDLADVEAIAASGVDREFLRAAVQQAAPDRLDMLERLFANADRTR